MYDPLTTTAGLAGGGAGVSFTIFSLITYRELMLKDMQEAINSPSQFS